MQQSETTPDTSQTQDQANTDATASSADASQAAPPASGEAPDSGNAPGETAQDAQTPDSAEAIVEEVDEEVRASFQEMSESVREWALETLDSLLSLSSAYQIVGILVAIGLGWILSRKPQSRIERMRDRRKTHDVIYLIYNAVSGAVWPIFVVVLLWLMTFIFNAIGQPSGILRVAASLANAAVIVRLLTRNMEKGPLRALIAWVAWSVAALYILKLLAPFTDALDRVSMSFGKTELSLLDVITSLIVAIAALWLGRLAGDAVQSQLRASTRLTPSMSGLLGQVSKIGLMILAVYIALNSVGFNMAAFAVLGGAIGVGIGFGLQSIFSNFISGIIILFEKSIKVGDFIELQSGVRGQVKEINIRSTLVNTNDDIDILVPNEEFIKAQVINWTLRDPRRRLRVPFGVAYGTDKELVKKAGLEAAAAVEWTIKTGDRFEPAVWLTEFGDSSLNYELVVWLDESAVKRPARVNADYNWALHTALEKYDLEIPFPQRDVNLRQPDPITVRLERHDGPDNKDDQKSDPT